MSSVVRPGPVRTALGAAALILALVSAGCGAGDPSAGVDGGGPTRTVVDDLSYEEITDPDGESFSGDEFQDRLQDAFSSCSD